MGWSLTEFYAATLPEFYAAWQGYLDRRKEEYLRTGTVVAKLHNVNRGKNDPPITASDIFPMLRSGGERSIPERDEDEWVGGKPTAEDWDI